MPSPESRVPESRVPSAESRVPSPESRTVLQGTSDPPSSRLDSRRLRIGRLHRSRAARRPRPSRPLPSRPRPSRPRPKDAGRRCRRSLLAAVARPARHRRVAHRDAAGRVERNEERPLEGARFPAAARHRRSSGAIGYLLTAVPAGVDGEAQHAPRGAQPRVRTSYVVLAIDRKTGKTVVGARRARRGAARGGASRQRHVGLALRRSPTAST